MSQYERELRKRQTYIKGTHESLLEITKPRILIISVVFGFFYLMIALRMMDLSLVQPALKTVDKTLEPSLVFAEQRNQDSLEIEEQDKKPGNSGAGFGKADIVDRQGILLATTVPVKSVYANPQKILDRENTAKALEKIFPSLDAERLEREFSGSRSFVWIKRHLSPQEVKDILMIGDPGLFFITENRRFYPQENLMSHVVGYSDIDGKALSGLEKAFDEKLSKDRSVVRTTLDLRLQHVLRKSLRKGLEAYSAGGAAGIIMDVRSGDILALVSLPDFNPNKITRSDKKHMFNRVLQGVYETGSIFKIFSAAAYIEKNGPDISRMFDAEKPLERNGFTIEDFHPEARKLSLPETFIYSSNIGSALMGEAVGTEYLKSFYKTLGLAEPVPVDLPGRGKPLVPDPWREINTLTASYGHGIAVTPLHVIQAAASIVNGGILVKPSITLENKNNDKPVLETRVVSEETSETLRKILRLAVVEGTGRYADVDGYFVGGKTGTAEKITNGQYDPSRLLSSFIGFFPMHDPDYAVLVVLDEADGTERTAGYATGGWIAAPAVGEIIRDMGRILGMPETGISDDSFLSSLYPELSKKGEDETGASFPEKMASH